ncbi:MAG: DUF4232 domain-containing protein [Catenulispora sp.]|nr:DUF4232 domain-containing protein [Catenulispora sp.]
MTNRIATKTRHLLPLAAITASALVGLTACASDTKPTAVGAGTTVTTAPAVGAPSGNPNSPGAQASSQTPSSPATAATTAATAPTTAPSAPKSTTQPPAAKPTTKTTKPSAPPAAGRPADCTTAHLKATVTNLTRPINHVLLTVTNTGSAPCSVYYYPDLRFDADQQAVTPPLEDSKPQAVVTIAPGESAYAAVGTSAADGSGGSGKLEKQVEMFLEARDQSGSLPGSLKLPLPANTYVDDKAFVTYWQSDLQSAVAW